MLNHDPLAIFSILYITCSRKQGKGRIYKMKHCLLTVRVRNHSIKRVSFLQISFLSFFLHLCRCFRLSSPALQALHTPKTHRSSNGARDVHSQAERVGRRGGGRVPTATGIYGLCRLFPRVRDRRAKHVLAQGTPSSREI